ncbi:MAG: MBL fold metallo-hydrolase, partial [Evtepia sp.]
FLGGLISLALGFIFFPIGQFAAFLVGFPIRYFVNCTLFFNQFNFAELTLDSFYYRLWLVFLYLILFLVWSERKKRPIIPICACIMTLCLAITLNSNYKGGFQLTVLDVGQGQSIAIGTRDFSALIDCGGAKTAGDTAARFWQSRGIGTLDLLILTHLHADHADGVPELISRLKIGTIFMPDTEPKNPLRMEIEGLAADHNIPIKYIRRQERFSIGETLFHIEAMVGDGSMNEEGLVILTTYENKSALITGDLPSEGEIDFLKRVHVPQLSLLVAGHHGSRYASSDILIAETKPYYTAISVGYNNYGHPSEETLARLKNSKLYRTDQSGAITFTVGE